MPGFTPKEEADEESEGEEGAPGDEEEERLPTEEEESEPEPSNWGDEQGVASASYDEPPQRVQEAELAEGHQDRGRPISPEQRTEDFAALRYGGRHSRLAEGALEETSVASGSELVQRGRRRQLASDQGSVVASLRGPVTRGPMGRLELFDAAIPGGFGHVQKK